MARIFIDNLVNNFLRAIKKQMLVFKLGSLTQNAISI